MQQLLRLNAPPTAVLASNDLTAIGALRGIRTAGLEAPEDISVVGFDDIELAEFTGTAPDNGETFQERRLPRRRLTACY